VDGQLSTQRAGIEAEAWAAWAASSEAWPRKGEEGRRREGGLDHHTSISGKGQEGYCNSAIAIMAIKQDNKNKNKSTVTMTEV